MSGVCNGHPIQGRRESGARVDRRDGDRIVTLNPVFAPEFQPYPGSPLIS